MLMLTLRPRPSGQPGLAQGAAQAGDFRPCLDILAVGEPLVQAQAHLDVEPAGRPKVSLTSSGGVNGEAVSWGRLVVETQLGYLELVAFNPIHHAMLIRDAA